MRELLFIALALACPLMMVLMMRGGHGGHGHHRKHERREPEPSKTDLVQQRDELDRLIAERERDESTSTTPTAGARS